MKAKNKNKNKWRYLFVWSCQKKKSIQNVFVSNLYGFINLIREIIASNYLLD
jgi:hypothetical protein